MAHPHNPTLATTALFVDPLLESAMDVVHQPTDTTVNPLVFKIARPYARAAFNLAMTAKELDVWFDFLTFFSLVMRNATFHSWWLDPRVSHQQLLDVLKSLGAQYLNAERERFLIMLIEAKRLPVLVEIATLFKTYRDEAEKALDAMVWTFMPFNDEQTAELKSTLEHRYDRTIRLQFQVEPRLMGGAVIRVGDDVIDGSVRGQLRRLRQQLSQ